MSFKLGRFNLVSSPKFISTQIYLLPSSLRTTINYYVNFRIFTILIFLLMDPFKELMCHLCIFLGIVTQFFGVFRCGAHYLVPKGSTSKIHCKTCYNLVFLSFSGLCDRYSIYSLMAVWLIRDSPQSITQAILLIHYFDLQSQLPFYIL